jgi:microcystin-dependent protein
MHIFFVHYGFGLFWCYCVKVLLIVVFGCHFFVVLFVIISVGLFFFDWGCVRVAYSDAIKSRLDDLYSTAGDAVSDLSGVVAGADVLASQFADVKNALQDLQDLADALRDGYAYTPTGVVVPFAGSDADKPPAGWYVCNGATWATLGLSGGDDLYDLLQPVGWLGVPDLRGRTVIGVGTGTGLTARALGASVGTETHVLSTSEIPAHSHAASQDDHTHTYSATVSGIKYFNTGSLGGSGAILAQQSSSGTTYTGAAVSGTTNGASAGSVYISNTGGGGAHTSMQPSLALNYLIKA